MILFTLLTALQKPDGIPSPNEDNPLNFSDPYEVMVYIVLPVCIAVFYFVWRKKRRK
ncbi:adenylosuccinate synthetase [Ochrovirga pacifica]|uniref:adenylosuccinate synthetase n=1 Tax=Ochrovirga pacifica TaxID=1042376 RepID=UPI0002557BA7|nr:adenylosuccinate synthetase [Ochrovirga pacifica]